VSTDGDVVCVETVTGKERWRWSLTRDFGGQMMSQWMFAESPLIDGDRVVVTPGGSKATLVALDKVTGRTSGARRCRGLVRMALTAPVIRPS
jgi:outer membrane protein assembly factor BamB